MPRADRLRHPLLLWGMTLLSAVLAGCAARRPAAAPPARWEFAQPQMGLPFRVVIYASDAGEARAGAEAAFARIAALNNLLSDYDTDSELNRLSRTAGEGRAVPVSPDLWHVLERAQALAARTDGAFDVTVGPLVSHWRKARREKRLPDPARLAAAAAAVGWTKLKLDPAARTATLLVPGMKLDLGGIAKGYAIDEALRVLRDRGLHRSLVSGGGDMAAGEPPPGRPGWRIEIAPLDVPQAPPARFVLLRHGALATSGDVFQRLEIEGVRYSHIVDPKTGLGLTDHSLVTVIAPDCLTADSLATAVSVLGPARGLDLIERTPGTALHWAGLPGGVLRTGESSRFAGFGEPP